jgi:predicted dehydrogenase
METTRRVFLQAAMAAPVMAAQPGANGQINTVVIGAGGRGTLLLGLALHRAREKGDVRIVGLCDVYQKRLDRAHALAKADGHDPKIFTHHQDLLAQRDIDAVIIATPDHWHAPITLAALESGRDVYCEKPMTHTLEEAAVVARRVKELSRVMQVGVQGTSWTRWHKVHELVEQGVLGKVVAAQGTYSRNDPKGDWNWPIDPAAGPDGKGQDHIDWKQWLGSAPEHGFDADRFFRFRKYWDYSGGIATDLHYHIVAPFHIALENEHPTRVTGMGGLWVYNDGRETPDTFLNSADYPGKYNVTVISSQVNEIGPVTLLRGTEATMHLGDEWEGPQGRDIDYARIVPDTPFKKDFVLKHGKDEIIVTGVGNEGDQKHMDNFFDCVHSRKQPNCHADLGYKVMTHIDLAVRSYREAKIFQYDALTGKVRG